MSTTFTHSRLAALLLPAAILMAGPQAPSAPMPDADEDYQGEASDRYAMVRVLEGDVRITKGDLDEALSRGTPIAEGDVVESRGRGVLQLGDGTRVAFGGDTRFTVATLFTDRNGEKQVLLRLDHGRLRVLLGGQSEAKFRVDTISGSVTCSGKGAFTIDAQRDRLVRLKVLSGRVTFANERDEARINAGERLTIYSPQDGLDRVRSFNTYDADAFDTWSESAMKVQRGESWDRVPAEIRYYADDLDGHGRWVQSDEFGWVWQPAGVAEDWRPYYQGRWAPYAGGMTWVSDEPWAYVAYHHGRWHWGAGVGWFWIPGMHYSPAWVAWNNTPGYCGWAPLGYYNTPCHWGYGAWGGGYAWNIVAIGHLNDPRLRTRIHMDVNVLRTFNGPGGRDRLAPWQRSPLMVTRAEFHNPAQIQGAFRHEVNRDRLRTYENQARTTTGRVIYREPRPTAPMGGGPRPERTPFEDRGRDPRNTAPWTRSPEPVRPGPALRPNEAPVPRERMPEPRERPNEVRPRPTDRPNEAPVPRERTPEPRERPNDVRPRPADRPNEAPVPRERTPEPRERPNDARPRVDVRPPEPGPKVRIPMDRPAEAPVPRERPQEPRPIREERRPEPPRERPQEPRPMREERRPEPARPAEARPTPKPEAPKERSKPERPKEDHR